MFDFKLYFSKSRQLAAVEIGDIVHFAKDVVTEVTVRTKWYENESPSMALVGSCKSYEISADLIILKK